jgi:hypothetical protein
VPYNPLLNSANPALNPANPPLGQQMPGVAIQAASGGPSPPVPGAFGPGGSGGPPGLVTPGGLPAPAGAFAIDPLHQQGVQQDPNQQLMPGVVQAGQRQMGGPPRGTTAVNQVGVGGAMPSGAFGRGGAR